MNHESSMADFMKIPPQNGWIVCIAAPMTLESFMLGEYACRYRPSHPSPDGIGIQWDDMIMT